MSILLLHEPNVSAAKSMLRSMLPGVRSGHLTEALAAGLGFRTHAALLAGIAAEAGWPPAIADTDDAAFGKRLIELGYGAPVAGLLGQLVRSDAIPDRPYREYAEADRQANEAHFAHCDRHGWPMIAVHMARTYATLEWDCITVAERPDDLLYRQPDGERTGDAMIRLFDQRIAGAPGKPHYRTNTFVGWVYKLLPDTARTLAEDYFRLLHGSIRQAARARAA
jgi:hypothetical protein